MKTLFTIIFSIFFSSVYAQNCIDTSFKKVYKTPNGSLINLTYSITQNDYSICVGRYINFTNNDTSYYIIKINPLGTVVWAKTIKAPMVHNGFVFVPKVSVLDNNDILLCTTDQSEHIFLVKFDVNGNLIWEKTINGFDNAVFQNPRLQVIDNELFITSAVHHYSGPLVGESLNTVLKLDENGTLLWSKYYDNQNCKSFYPTGLMAIGSNLVSWGRLMDNACFNSNNPATQYNWYSLKLNKQTGDIITSILYESEKEFSNLSSWYYIGFNGKGLDPDEFAFTSSFRDPASGHVNPVKVVFNGALNIVNAFLYNTNNLFGNPKGQVDADGNLNLFFSRSNPSSGNPSHFIAKVNRRNDIIRQKKLFVPPGSLAFYAGREPFDYKRNYISLAANYKIADTSIIQFTQLSNDEENGSCFGTDTTFLEIRPFLFRPVQSAFISQQTNLNLQVNNLISSAKSLQIIKEDYCELISTCSSLILDKLIDTICHTNQTYTFRAHLNPGCQKHVFWQIDTAAISFLQIVDDTTVAVKFKKQWTGNLYASINSCSLVKDSILIHVLPSPDSVNLGNDTSICKADTLFLKVKTGFKNYLWQNNSMDSVFKVYETGQYFVTATDYCNNILTDTIKVTVNDRTEIFLPSDTSVCSGNSIMLDAGPGFSSYYWSTNETTSNITVTEPGIYIVTAINNFNCATSDSFRLLNVYPLPQISLPKKSIYCRNQGDTLLIPDSYSFVRWQDLSMGNHMPLNESGWYKVTVGTSFGCQNSDSVFVKTISNTPVKFLSTDTSFCDDLSFTLKPKNNFEQYLWNNGSTSPSIQLARSGIYTLKVTDANGCTGLDSIRVNMTPCPETIFFPNSFTPNNDGKNDVFRPSVSRPLAFYQFTIYNRYGQKVFESSNPQTGWDGTLKGTDQNSGAFIWQCNYRFGNKPTVKQKGHLLLLR